MIYPNVHYTGFSMMAFSVLAVLYDEHLISTCFFCMGAAFSLLAFEFSSPLVIIVYFAHTLPKLKHQLSLI